MNVIRNLQIAAGAAIVVCSVSLIARSRGWVLWGFLAFVVAFGLLMAWDAR